MCVNQNPHPNVKGINPQAQRGLERKQQWMRRPHSVGAGRWREGDGTGLAEAGVCSRAPAMGEMETEARRLAVTRLRIRGMGVQGTGVRPGCEQGNGAKICRGTN